MKRPPMARFQIDATFRTSWELLKRNAGPIYLTMIGCYVVTGAASLLLRAPGSGSSQQLTAGSLIGSLAYGLIGLVAQMIITRMFLEVTAGRRPTVAGVTRPIGPDLVLKYFGLQIIFLLLVIVGSVALIIPGIYFGLKYMFAQTVLLDRGGSIGAAFTRSGEIMKGQMLYYVVFALAALLLILVSAIPFGLGLILAVPLVSLAQVVVYRRLDETFDGAPQA